MAEDLRNYLLSRFQDDPNRLRRTDDFYLPLFHWVEQVVSRHASQGPCLIGVNGPQGAGKSTITQTFVELFGQRGKEAVSISIDDFYLTRAEQVALAGHAPKNPYLQNRGYPGTHDIPLGAGILKALKAGSAGKLLCPVYDKSAHQGRGDRLPEEKWVVLPRRPDAVFLEGWMLGFPPVPDAAISDEALKEVNACLKGYEQWTRLLDAFVYLMPRHPEYVIDWRIEAEEKMKSKGKPGMTKNEVTDYVMTFMPAYRLFAPALAANPPQVENYLCIEIGEDRLPTKKFLGRAGKSSRP